jgi:hypothetical protein
MKVAELDMIARVLALHLVAREQKQQQQQQQQQQQEQREEEEQQEGEQAVGVGVAPDRADMVRRLAEELGLREALVGEKLAGAFVAIRRQEQEEGAMGEEGTGGEPLSIGGREGDRGGGDDDDDDDDDDDSSSSRPPGSVVEQPLQPPEQQEGKALAPAVAAAAVAVDALGSTG